MIVYVLSRHRFDLMLEENNISDSNVDLYKDAMFISILDTRAVPAGITHKPVFKEKSHNVLTLAFDDVINEEGDARRLDEKGEAFIMKGRGITKNQAKQIVDFIHDKLNEGVTHAFVHCAAGISRSGAVGSFISTLMNIPYDDFRRVNPGVYENPTVMKLLREQWNDRIS